METDTSYTHMLRLLAHSALVFAVFLLIVCFAHLIIFVAAGIMIGLKIYDLKYGEDKDENDKSDNATDVDKISHKVESEPKTQNNDIVCHTKTKPKLAGKRYRPRVKSCPPKILSTLGSSLKRCRRGTSVDEDEENFEDLLSKEFGTYVDGNIELLNALDDLLGIENEKPSKFDITDCKELKGVEKIILKKGIGR